MEQHNETLMEQHNETLVLRQRCDKCNEVLGAQNPGTRCGMCKFVEREAKRVNK